jgi:beta-glucanase (GH16 family)
MIHRYTDTYSRKRFSKEFFIYTLEWLPGRITWKINGIEVASTVKGIPDEPMYMVFSAGLQKDVSGILPATFEIDWVRCYQTNNNN